MLRFSKCESGAMIVRRVFRRPSWDRYTDDCPERTCLTENRFEDLGQVVQRKKKPSSRNR